MTRLLAERLARSSPPVVTAIVIALSLILHEAIYILAGGDDFPLRLAVNETDVLKMSHGGLDALGVGMLAVAALLTIEAAHRHLERNRA